MFIVYSSQRQHKSSRAFRLYTTDSWRGLHAPRRRRGQSSTGPVSASGAAEHSSQCPVSSYTQHVMSPPSRWTTCSSLLRGTLLCTEQAAGRCTQYSVYDHAGVHLWVHPPVDIVRPLDVLDPRLHDAGHAVPHLRPARVVAGLHLAAPRRPLGEAAALHLLLLIDHVFIQL